MSFRRSSRLTRSTSFILIIAVGVLLALGLSIFRSYLGTRLSGISLSQTVVGGALKSEAVSLGSHILEFRGRTRDGKVLNNQVTFAVQAPDIVVPNPDLPAVQELRIGVPIIESVIGGATPAFINAFVTLDRVAPANGAQITLSSSNPAAATVPATITVSAGQPITAFPITTHSVTKLASTKISATYNGVTKTDTLIVRPPFSQPPSNDTYEVPLKFRVDAALLADASEAVLRERLTHYIDDVNAIYASTRLRFTYNPATDFEVWRSFDGLGGRCQPLAPNHVQVIYVQKSTTGRSDRAHSLCNDPDPAVFSSIVNWQTIWAPEDIAANVRTPSGTPASFDFTHQILTLVHEMGHNYGAGGVPEYYDALRFTDSTGVAPLISDAAYSSARHLVRSDPMFSGTRFSPMSIEIINRAVDGRFPDRCDGVPFSCFRVPYDDKKATAVVVEAVDARTLTPIAGCQVSMYGIEWVAQGNSAHARAPALATDTTERNGQSTFEWGNSLYDFNTFVRLFKVQCPGYQPSGEWLTVFDMQAGWLMPNGGVEGDFRYPGKLTIKMQPR